MGDGVLSRKFNVYDAVTQKIVSAIEAGAGPYRCPWHVPGGATLLPTNASTLAAYRGVNVLGLWIDAQVKGYACGLWASYRQWQLIGAQVRKGERGSLVVFYKRLEAKPFEEEDHEEGSRLSFVARASFVFNAAQVDGYAVEDACPVGEVERMREVDAFVEAIGATIRHGYRMAQYDGATDAVEMPNLDRFTGTDTISAQESYYATLLHELTHWTGPKHRLDRILGKRFGDEAYAMEELVAELGAAFACAALGIASEPRPDHAAYIDHWLRVLKRDNRAIFTAATKAQEAFEYLCYLATRNESK
jgi:antirestriction protein ArdC